MLDSCLQKFSQLLITCDFRHTI
ncbi:hypothetical protein PL8927_760283 [Planktothrix serta PCC 8927]|uniref:Uncharacterized protein n=1 Tax=Planktothrix serta PCC 8927 TaxID=671068 RepID=A0A7Z9BXQ9_9CYAN|nr:hypothetical protein PL8927_760283 [Planktothrix serta PCC 8927]